MLLAILKIACDLFGLSEWLDGWLKKREAAEQAQTVANAPTTKDELDETLARHDF